MKISTKAIWRTARKIITYLPGILNMADKVYDEIMAEYKKLEEEEKQRREDRRAAAAKIIIDLDADKPPDIIQVWKEAEANLKASGESDSPLPGKTQTDS